MLYNSKFEVVPEVFEYLNLRNKLSSENTSLQALYALKHLYIFSEIIEKQIQDFKFEDFQRLTYFLKGISANGNDMELSLLTKRGSTSVNIFLATYRQFYRFLNLNDSPIFQSKGTYKMLKNIDSNKSTKYSLGMNSKVNTIEVPKYISTDEFTIIINYVRKNITNKVERLQTEAIIRIMYEGGLRLGEVLGLTLEDLEIKQVNDKEICFVYIRNRITDRNFQNAKTCMKVFSKKNYSSYEYNTRSIGYQLSFLNLDTYDLIGEYIDIAHDKALRCQKSNYNKYKADSISTFKEKNQDNYYIFLNNRSTPLSDVSWNSRLRKIFNAVGINTDSKSKTNNLSHRFRHGFVMHLIYDLKLPREMVMMRSRHRSYKGLDAYYNPTIEEIVKMKTEIEDELFLPDILNEINQI